MGQGTLKIQLYVGDYALHGQEMTVLIKKDGEILYSLLTNKNGATEEITLDCPCITADSPAAGASLFETYDVVVPPAHGFMQVSVYGVQIFDGIPSILNIQLEPYVEGGPEEIEINIPPEHGVDIDRDNGSPDGRPPDLDPGPPDDSVPAYVPLANEVVVPEFITVHLGAPSANANQVRVGFQEYVVNVACSEIYPHWEATAIEANVHAQVSFALNRLFTHWYRSRGRNFDMHRFIKNLTPSKTQQNSGFEANDFQLVS